jgi:hypothetical protein
MRKDLRACHISQPMNRNHPTKNSTPKRPAVARKATTTRSIGQLEISPLTDR